MDANCRPAWIASGRLAELADTEQRRIGAELHDSLGQQITALGMLSSDLWRRLEEREAPEAEKMAAIVDHLQTAKDQISALIDGVIPIEVRAESLGDALKALADRMTRIHDVDCRYRGPESIEVPSDQYAMHLYRIAQESTLNAIRHGEADQVIIEWREDGEESRGILRIRDDGRGFREGGEPSPGRGLRIMRHRADLLGGDLHVRSLEEGGVLVECVTGAEETLSS